MREFRAYEYVDGDITVYVREEGQGDDAWTKAGVVKFGEVKHAGLVMDRLGLTGPTGHTSLELDRLSDELAMPRRW